MKTTNPIEAGAHRPDAQRVALADDRADCGRSSPSARTRRAGRRVASWRRLLEHEVAERGQVAASNVIGPKRDSDAKTLASFDFAAVPMVEGPSHGAGRGDTWLEKGANLLLFARPACGKTRLAAAIGPPRRERMARAVHAHQRSRATPADRPS